MKPTESSGRIILDVNHPEFLQNLLHLEKNVRHSAMETLKKVSQMTWNQVYRDQGLKWEKIVNATPPSGVESIYSLRLTQSRRATAYRDGNFLRFLSIPPDHDATYGKK